MPITLFSVRLLFLFVSFCFGVNANASVIDDIYEAKIAVTDQSSKTQQQAITQGFKQVLLKVSGNKSLASEPSLKSVMNKGRSFVRSYRYEYEQSQLILVANFDQNKINDLLSTAGFAIWDKRRPDTIVWLALKPSINQPRLIMNENEHSDFYQQLTLAAKQRGIRLTFPLWDLQDRQNLGVYDIWGGFSEQIEQASERYSVASILSARIYPSEASLDETSQDVMRNSSNQWTADWGLTESGQSYSGLIQLGNLTQVAESLVDALADTLAEKYAVDLTRSNQDASTVRVVINNIDSLIYYQQALEFLNNLSVVQSATLVKQQGSTATYELIMLAEVEALVNAINLDNKIRPVVDDFGQPEGGVAVLLGQVNNQLSLPVSLQDVGSFASFIVGKNAAALAHLQQLVSSEHPVSSANWLTYLFADKGLGKSHLLYALCQQANLMDKNCVYLSFNEIDDLGPDVLQGLEYYPLICLDDINKLKGEPAWQVAVFDLINRVKEHNNSCLVITGNQPPAGLNLTLPDLVSRLSWGTNFQIHSLNDEERQQALIVKAKHRGLNMPKEVAKYLVNHWQRDMPALIASLDKLDEKSLQQQRKLTIPFVKAILKL